MSRYPPKTTSQLPRELQAYGERLDKYLEPTLGQDGVIFTYRDENGGLIGPFPILIASKDAGEMIGSLLGQLEQFEGLPRDAREVAILAVSAYKGTSYQIYSHSLAAVKGEILSQSQVDLVAAKKKPQELSPSGDISYDVALHLVEKPGPLPQPLYDSCIKILGSEGTLGLIHFVGLYCYICILMNAADVPVP